jgi:AcrR family transcriptional regulator
MQRQRHKASQREEKYPMDEFDENIRADMSIRERHRQITRQAILDAAHTVFQKHGLRAVTIDQITSAARINRATFYLHFKDKIDVAANLSRRLVTRHKEHYSELATLRSPTRASVRKWVERYLAFVDDERLLTAMLTEATSAEPAFAQEYLDYLARIADTRLEALLARATGKPRAVLRSKLILLQMMMSHYGYYTVGQALTFPGKFPIDALADIWWNEVFSPQS